MSLVIDSICRDDLLADLQARDISVLPRTGGRTKLQTQEYTISHLLSALATNHRLGFPVVVRGRDRPDVFIKASDTEIGVEITEAIPKQFAWLSALAEQEFPGRWFPVDHFPWDKLGLTKNEMRNLLRAKAVSSSGWLSHEPEWDWAQWMQKTVETKLSKLRDRDFTKFKQNWLYIYDNLPLPSIQLTKSVCILRSLLVDSWDCHPSFDIVFIEKSTTEGMRIVAITSKKTEYLPVNAQFHGSGTEEHS